VFSPFAAWGDFPGSSGDYFSTPDSAAADLSGNATVVMYLALDDWTPSTLHTLLSKWDTTDRAYALDLSTDGKLNFVASSDGTNTTLNKPCTIALGFSNGTGHWVRGTIDYTAGTVSYYKSDSSPWTPYNKIAWELIETISHSDTAMANSAETLKIGAQLAGGTTNVSSGKVMRAAVIASTDPTVAPSVDFDARTFTPGVTTATASTGEVWTANGNVSIEQNIPAPWDASGPLGYLSEQAGTNLITHSLDYSNAAWTNTGPVTITANADQAPDGSTTAVTLEDNGGATVEFLADTVSVANDSATYTFSVPIKKDSVTSRFPEISANLTGGTAANSSVQLNTKTGEVASRTGTASSNYGVINEAGYWRLWVKVANNSSGNTTLQLNLIPARADALGGSTSTNGTITVWHSQCETISFPTSVIPTSGAAGTRNADVLTYSAVGNADSFPMTVSAEHTPHTLTLSGARVISIDDGTANERVQILYPTGTPRLLAVDGGATQASVDSGNGTLIVGVTSNLAGTVAANDFELYQEGVSAGTDVSGTAGIVPTTIRIGMDQVSASHTSGTIRNVKIFNKRLNDSQVKNL
jgi:hypothetical protein